MTKVDDEKTKAAGCLVLTLWVLLVMFGIAVSLFVGIRFGAEWGWAAVAVVIGCCCAFIVFVIRRIVKGLASVGRDDG